MQFPQGPRLLPGRPLRASKKQASQKRVRKRRRCEWDGERSHAFEITDKVDLRNWRFSRPLGVPIENQIEILWGGDKVCKRHLRQALVKGFQRISQRMF